jgi:hypothetical protein
MKLQSWLKSDLIEIHAYTFTSDFIISPHIKVQEQAMFQKNVLEWKHTIKAQWVTSEKKWRPPNQAHNMERGREGKRKW